MLNECLGLLATGTSYRKNYALKSDKVLDFTQNTEL